MKSAYLHCSRVGVRIGRKLVKGGPCLSQLTLNLLSDIPPLPAAERREEIGVLCQKVRIVVFVFVVTQQWRMVKPQCPVHSGENSHMPIPSYDTGPAFWTVLKLPGMRVPGAD